VEEEAAGRWMWMDWIRMSGVEWIRRGGEKKKRGGKKEIKKKKK
jgi:hypothetical protein